MERIGIFVVSYGARCAAIAHTLSKSQNYKVDLYIADKQRNPLNARIGKVHQVIPDLDVQKLCQFADKYREAIDFGIVGAEGPIIDGLRDLVEKKARIPMICPIKDLAIEKSKVEQRQLLSEIIPHVNPPYKIFVPKGYPTKREIMAEAEKWITERGGAERVVIKPDKPGYGKGVGVGGEHFFTIAQATEHFRALLGEKVDQKVIIEDRIEGEESSHQTWCDGKTLLSLPETRDYKRAFDGDIGPNTGGMGSYRDVEEFLPFIRKKDWEIEIDITKKIFHKLTQSGNGVGLRGTPFYIAFIHTASEPKILEINSRPGDPEIMAILPTLEEDFVDVCYDMVHGTLGNVKFRKESAVVTYAVPLTYGGYRENFTGSSLVNLSSVTRLTESYQDKLKVYPGSMELKNNHTYTLKSRAIAIVGVGDSIQEAREVSLNGIRCIDGPLWNRWDIASEKNIGSCITHMNELRCR